MCCSSTRGARCCRSTAGGVSADRRPRRCRRRPAGCCTVACGRARRLDVADRTVTMQTLGRRDELRGVLAVALAGRPDAAATAVITSAVALAEFAVEDAAQREESTLALNAQLFHLALAGHVSSARDVLVAAGRQLPEAPLRLLLTPLRHRHRSRRARTRPGRPGSPLPATRAWRPAGRDDSLRPRTPRSPTRPEVISARQTPVIMSRPIGWSDLVGGSARDHARPWTVLPGRPGGRAGDQRHARAAVARGHRDLARERLAPLLAAPDAADLRRVLETWLRHNAAWDPAARELGMHRHTLKAQVKRAGDACSGWISTPSRPRLELWALLTAGT